MTEGAAAPLSNADQVIAKISELQEKLQTASPGYETLLFSIHQALSKDDELVHLLSEEQVGVVCSALSKRKNVVISEVDKPKKNTTPSGKKLKDVQLGADL